MSDCISREDALAYPLSWEHYDRENGDVKFMCGVESYREYIESLPSASPEPLTDKEQRIFLAAMEREERVCEEVDRNYVREPYEDSLMRVCKEIRRKVKGALWT